MIAASITKDQRAKLAARRGAASSTVGSTHKSLSLEESLAYIDTVFDEYRTYGELTDDHIKGARILELGPGDNHGVALRFLGSGAAQVIGIDKFVSARNEEQQQAIYASLLRRLPASEHAWINAVIQLDKALEFDSSRLRVLEGVAVEEAATALPGQRFDLIVSRAVLEHLYDLDAAFAAIDDLLAPGGLMLHKVDLRDHGIFTGGGMHPLTFLTIPNRIYRLMSRHSGRPNRRLVDWYRRKLDDLGYDFRMLVTHVVGQESEFSPYIEQTDLDVEDHPRSVRLAQLIRPRLDEPFRHLTDKDLITSGVFFTARKPAA